ncbi:MAG: hypothetical protein IPK60_22740 [Sandaracinaceae bacterium]|nr:hypothetical protein [Sandaracinaceae bacterium]
MSAAKNLVDPVERIARAAERIADMLERQEMRAKQKLRVTPKTAKYVEANDTDKALANRVATKLGLKLVHNGGRK